MRPYKIEWYADQWRRDTHKLHVDLDHILAISEPYFVDRMGHGGYFARFDITMAFLDKPIIISIHSAADHSGPTSKPVMINGVPEGVVRLTDVFRDLYCAKFGEYPI